MYDSIIVGCGFAGAVVARELAERGGQNVCIIEKRNHIGGNCYDLYDNEGILIHQYGPHIFHTNKKEILLKVAGGYKDETVNGEIVRIIKRKNMKRSDKIR